MFLNNNIAPPYQVIEAPLGALTFSAPFFLQPAFLYRTPHSALVTFQLWGSDSTRLLACVSFVLENNTAISLPSAPFGSFYGEGNLTAQAAMFFVKEIKTLLSKKSCKEITIKHYPACYGKSIHDLFVDAMLKEGFEISCQELNQYIVVSDQPFSEGLHDSAGRRLKKCHEAGFQISIEHEFKAEEWFDRIVRARRLKGHPLSIDLESLKMINAVNPLVYNFVSVHDKGKIIASAIAIEVMPDVLYYYLPADEEAYLQYSPMVMLVEALYSFAQQKNMRIVDLGISSSGGVINEGLRNFKNNLGAHEEFKMVLISSLSHV